jgi:glycosyltransferase involved in cell wall biosynthesis
LFNLLSRDYSVTVLHSGKCTVTENDNFKEIIVPVKKTGPIYFQFELLKEVKKDYDYIILLFDVRWICTLLAALKYNDKSKLILWGAWMTKRRVANLIRIHLTKKADANIFYTETTRRDFIQKGISPETLFVANNTFDVGKRVKSFEHLSKNRILFVGSLQERKQNDVLIHAFSKIIDKIPNDISLSIIGDGPEYKKLKGLVKELNIENRVEFLGRINDPIKLRQYYKEAIVNVSFGQAGLTVLQSFGFGVPFLTKYNAISGGEITNIKHEVNGFLCDDSETSLEQYILNLCLNIDFAIEMGKNAYHYYSNYCTISNMAQGFLDAIENTRLAKIDTNF